MFISNRLHIIPNLQSVRVALIWAILWTDLKSNINTGTLQKQSLLVEWWKETGRSSWWWIILILYVSKASPYEMVSRELLDTCYIIKCILVFFYELCVKFLIFFSFSFFLFRLVNVANSIETGERVSTALSVYKYGKRSKQSETANFHQALKFTPRHAEGHKTDQGDFFLNYSWIINMIIHSPPS